MEKKKNSYSGLGMGACPHKHQLCVGVIHGRLINKIPCKYSTNFLIDSTVDEIDWQKGEKKIRPDISFYADVNTIKDDVKHTNLLLVIEIVNNNGVSYSKGRIEALFRRSQTLREAFLYNYEKNQWIRFSRKEDGVWDEEKDYSTVFGFYMGPIGNSCVDIESTSYPVK